MYGYYCKSCKRSQRCWITCLTSYQLNSYCTFILTLDCPKHPQKISFQIQLWWNVLRPRFITRLCNWKLIKRSFSMDFSRIRLRNLQCSHDYLQKMDKQLLKWRSSCPTRDLELCSQSISQISWLILNLNQWPLDYCYWKC